MRHRMRRAVRSRGAGNCKHIPSSCSSLPPNQARYESRGMIRSKGGVAPPRTLHPVHSALRKIESTLFHDSRLVRDHQVAPERSSPGSWWRERNGNEAQLNIQAMGARNLFDRSDVCSGDIAETGVRLADKLLMMRLKNKVSGLSFEVRRDGGAGASPPSNQPRPPHLLMYAENQGEKDAMSVQYCRIVGR